MRNCRNRSLSLLLSVAAAVAALAPLTRAAIYTVTLATDANPGSPAGTGSGVSAAPDLDMRAAILAANAAGGSNTIDFQCGAPCAITLGGPLPPIASDLTIDGGTGGVRLDGASKYRPLFVDTGTVVLKNVGITNGMAKGGNGGKGLYGGGGGAGLGGCLFIDKSTASVTLNSVQFNACSAVGGDGGNPGSGLGGGGGSMAFAGADAGTGAGGGGARVLAAGFAGNGTAGGNGGAGGGGGGAGSTDGTAGSAYVDGSAGQSGTASSGGNGGFGGGRWRWRILR